MKEKNHSKDNKRIIKFSQGVYDYQLVFNPNTQGKRYTLQMLKDGVMLEEKLLTGVTTALNAVSKPFLMTWTVKEMARYIKDNCEVEDGRYELDKRDVENAMKAYITKRDHSTDVGTKAHDFMEDYVRVSIEENNKKPINLIDFNKFNLKVDDDIIHIVERFVTTLTENFIELLASEQPVCSVKYGFAGTFDLLAKDKDGKVVLVDFKTSNQVDSLYASQIEAYKRGMKEMWNKDVDYGAVIRSDKMTDDEIEEYNKSFTAKKYPKTPLEYIEYKNRDSYWMLFLCAMGIHRTGVMSFNDARDIEEFLETY